ncbi:hypothetical protein Y710_14325 [Gordonia sp. QH-12]|nr:hypothetical protein Y710_14325 [Gordonia sp. QH-12]
MTSTTPNDTDVLDFWSGGAGRWRVERDGEVQYISDGRRTFYRDSNGAAVELSGRGIRMPWLTTHISPIDLVGQSGVLHQMTRDVIALTTPVPVRRDGRPAWSTLLGRPGLTITIDDRSGLIVELSSGRGFALTVTSLSSGPVDDDAFAWPWPGNPPVEEVISDRQRTIDRSAILEAITSAVDRRTEVLAAIASSTVVDDARTAVAGLLGTDEAGTDAVLAMQLRKFTRFEREKIRDEAENLRALLDNANDATNG